MLLAQALIEDSPHALPAMLFDVSPEKQLSVASLSSISLAQLEDTPAQSLYGYSLVPTDVFDNEKEVMNANPVDLAPAQLLYKLHIESLRLMTAMCCGRNEQTKKLLLESDLGISHNSLLCVFRDDALPPALRTACLSLLCTLFVDAEPQGAA